MSKSWIDEKAPVFVRDMLRDFCQAVHLLEAEFSQFEIRGSVDFETLRELLGERNNKGLLWRLKDTCHHLFRNDASGSLVGQFLDWSVGYIFHECMKLKEDAYQRENYGPWFKELLAGELSQAERAVSQELFQVVMQTNESMRREIGRIRFIVAQCQELLPIYLSCHKDNELLARFFFEREEQVHSVFKDAYNYLVRGIYGESTERMYLLAAQSLRQGGWTFEAARAVEVGLKHNPGNEALLREREIVDTWRKRLDT